MRENGVKYFGLHLAPNGFETDNFKDEDFPVFQSYFNEKYIQNIRKTFNELVTENGVDVIKSHIIYISLNYQENKTRFIEIEKCEKKNLRHLKLEVLNGCLLNNVNSLLEKYNSAFEVDSSNWYQIKPTTDIYIMSEKTDEDTMNNTEIFYEKDISKFSYYEFDLAYTRKFVRYGEYLDVSPNEVVQKYQKLKPVLKQKYVPPPPKPKVVKQPPKPKPEKPKPAKPSAPGKNTYTFNSEQSGPNGNFKFIVNINGVDVNNGQFKNFFNNGEFNNFFSGGDKNNNDQFKKFFFGGGDEQDQNGDNKKGPTRAEQKEENENKIRVPNGIPLKDGSGIIIYEMDNEGNIYQDGKIDGKFEKDGIVRNGDKEKVAEIDKNGVFKNQNGDKMGEIDSKGIIKDVEGQKIGEVDANMNVKDENGNKIGEAKGITQQQAAYIYFFKL